MRVVAGARGKLSRDLHVRAYAGDYFDVLESQPVLSDRKMLAMLMGSNIGNYEPDEARLLFSLLGSALRPGDGLLVGADLRKDRATLEMAYDDPHRCYGGFQPQRARARSIASCDGGLRSAELPARRTLRRAARLGRFVSGSARAHGRSRYRGANLRITVEAGERIHTESSYKFADEDVARLAEVGGFRPRSAWHDGAKRFSVHLLVRQ